jgi:hypothetical protein
MFVKWRRYLCELLLVLLMFALGGAVGYRHAYSTAFQQAKDSFQFDSLQAGKLYDVSEFAPELNAEVVSGEINRRLFAPRDWQYYVSSEGPSQVRVEGDFNLHQNVLACLNDLWDGR